MIESPQWYPTRLIEVGGRGKLPCLIVSSEHSPTGPYLTLSHCWGNASILQLTADTLPSFKDRNALRDLPKTFEHALMVARELQVEYIWIDSLCIIQDDPEDWLHESALMHKIYSNAMCNIAATGAVDSSEGLFFERDPSYVKPVRTRLRHDVTTVEFEGLYDISEVDFWKDAVLEAPLNRRGWVCQERLLAPRILHFGKNQLLWECCVMEAAEKYPHGLLQQCYTRTLTLG
jgi:Heterokaryon incompatibility protein (HET)